ncbi:hypothetical protein ACFQ0G_10245 [Streptomyces chiangmaiensis]
MTTLHNASGVHPVLGVDAGTATLRQADHLIHDLVDRLDLPPGTIACTHLIRTAERRARPSPWPCPTPKRPKRHGGD